MELHWEYAGNDVVAKKDDLVFRLHEKHITVKNFEYGSREKELQTYHLQIKKQDNISFKDLGYTFYMYRFNERLVKSIDQQTWQNINDVVDKTEEILDVLGFI